MGTLIFDGEPPFEVVNQRLPTATSEGETVILTLSVRLPGFPVQTAEMQVRLMLEHAEQLAAQIQPAVQRAQVRKGW
jgi:hypothetical protein